MKIRSIIVAIGSSLLLSGCLSNDIKSLDERLTALETTGPVTEQDTKRIVGVLLSGQYHEVNKPSKTDAVQALGLFKRTEAVPDILRVVKASDNQNFRTKCHNALGWMGDKRAVSYLKKAARNDDYYYARLAAAVAVKSLTGEVIKVKK